MTTPIMRSDVMAQVLKLHIMSGNINDMFQRLHKFEEMQKLDASEKHSNFPCLRIDEIELVLNALIADLKDKIVVARIDLATFTTQPNVKDTILNGAV